MKYSNRIVLVFVLALLNSACLCGQTLWQKASVGMTPEQVKAAYPEAKWNKEGKEMEHSTTLFDHVWTVLFSFNNAASSRTLHKVSLKLNEETLNEIPLTALRRKVVEALQSKYGEMVLDTPATKTPFSMHQTTWHSADKVSITLRSFFVRSSTSGTKSASGMILTYETSAKTEANKL